MNLIALVDCNQFFVSCEKLFAPQLRGKAVVVLSNNDGNVVARSEEAKKLGIPMGAPFFKWADFFKAHKVEFFSSNYPLYGDMSSRVMQTLLSFSYDLEIYSIDEAFLNIDSDEPEILAMKIVERVKRWTGIPVTVGIAKTKTLAKVASHLGKKGGGICLLNDAKAIEEVLKKLPVEEVWGIGSALKKRLHKASIYSAYDFSISDQNWIKKEMGLVGQRIAQELKGNCCLKLEESPPPKKGIISSRSFSEAVFDLELLLESVAHYTATAAKKLRAQGSVASFMQIYLITNRFDEKFAPFSSSKQIVLQEPTDFTPTLIKEAKAAAMSLFQEGIPYKKTAVFLGGIEKRSALPLFPTKSKNEQLKEEKLMHLMDLVNKKGKGKLHFAAEGIERPWKMKQEKRTGSYTTDWNDLYTILL